MESSNYRYLAPRFMELASLYGLYGNGSFYSDRTRRAGIETVAHELAHVLVADLPLMRSSGFQNSMSKKVIDLISDMAHNDADEQEVVTLAVQYLALQRLGMKISLRALCSFAMTGLSPYSYMSKVELMEAVQSRMGSPRTKSLVDQFVDVVVSL